VPVDDSSSYHVSTASQQVLNGFFMHTERAQSTYKSRLHNLAMHVHVLYRLTDWARGSELCPLAYHQKSTRNKIWHVVASTQLKHFYGYGLKFSPSNNKLMNKQSRKWHITFKNRIISVSCAITKSMGRCSMHSIPRRSCGR